jgi:hypothetical protein
MQERDGKTKYAVGKKSNGEKKQMVEKIKYEININLPLARAHHFESEGQDFSPACLPFAISFR